MSRKIFLRFEIDMYLNYLGGSFQHILDAMTAAALCNEDITRNEFRVGLGFDPWPEALSVYGHDYIWKEYNGPDLTEVTEEMKDVQRQKILANQAGLTALQLHQKYPRLFPAPDSK